MFSYHFFPEHICVNKHCLYYSMFSIVQINMVVEINMPCFSTCSMDLKCLLRLNPMATRKQNHPFSHNVQNNKRIKSLATTSTPKRVVHAVTDEKGGELNARGTSFLPRNRQQVANFRRSTSRTKYDDVLYSIMMECKLSQGKNELYVQDVKAAPEPQSILFSGWQLQDLVRFCTDNRSFTPLSVDTTFNLGDFYDTPVSYYHLFS